MLGNLLRGAPFKPDSDIPNLDGQVYVVTGASSGIGFAITAHLLRNNAAKIITLSSREENAMHAIENLKHWGDTSRVAWHYCDLKDLRQVDQVSKKIKAEESRIDALILNAGIGVTKFSLSKDGLDSHFQINMLAQLHMALVLLPVLQKTSLTGTPSRIVFMSSSAHRSAPKSVRFASVEELNTDLGQTDLYYRSKLAQILIARELAWRFGHGQAGSVIEKGEVLVNATHPGDLVWTPLIEELGRNLGWKGWLMLLFCWPFMPDAMTVGCRSALFAGTPNMDLLAGRGINGQYIVPDKKIESPSEKARDPEMGKRLWKLSMGLLEEKLGKIAYAFP